MDKLNASLFARKFLILCCSIVKYNISSEATNSSKIELDLSNLGCCQCFSGFLLLSCLIPKRVAMVLEYSHIICHPYHRKICKINFIWFWENIWWLMGKEDREDKGGVIKISVRMIEKGWLSTPMIPMIWQAYTCTTCTSRPVQVLLIFLQLQKYCVFCHN